MSRVIFLFPTTRDAVRAFRACQKAEMVVQMIPVPSNLSADCGIALETDGATADSAAQVFAVDGIRSNGIITESTQTSPLTGTNE